jgi:hypothetical protein
VDLPRHVEREPPGSGAYNVRKEGNDAVKFTLKARQFVALEAEIPGPGPGKYCPDFAPVMRQNPRTQILTRWEERKKEQAVGYVGRPADETGLKFTIGKRLGNKILPGLAG